MYECPNCGGNLKFDIPSQQLSCAYCESKFDPYSIQKETDTVEGDLFEANVFSCPQCGAEMICDANDATSFCSYCGSANILSSRISREKRPQFIIPFRITKEDCKKAYQARMKKAFFAPKELRDPKYIDSFRGIYMPYWSYRLSQRGRILLHGQTEKRKGDYVYKDHYNLSADLDAGYAGYTCDASSGFSDNISRALGPYKVVDQIQNFTPSFLSGFYAETADLRPGVYLRDAEIAVSNITMDHLKKEPFFQKYGLQSPSEHDRVQMLYTRCDGEDSAMFPVWFMSWRNKDRIAYATVNGQNGKVVTDMPVDPKRFFGSSLLAAIPIFLILNLFFTLRPAVLLTCGALLAVAAAFLYKRELAKILALETYADDKGMWVKKPQSGNTGEKGPKTDSLTFGKLLSTCMVALVILISLQTVNMAEPAIWVGVIIAMIVLCADVRKEHRKLKEINGGAGAMLAMAALGIGAVVRLVQPVSDMCYYASALLILLTVVFILADLIRNYNRLAMRKLPQFNKRGGDDNA